MRQVVELLNLRWHVPHRVAELAQVVGLGPSRLEHLFKQHARVSIRDFLRERRLAAAAELLATTPERVSVISFRCGFQHAANFNHAFKKRFGVSPREYRSRTQQVNAENTKQLPLQPVMPSATIDASAEKRITVNDPDL
ncbi:MAG TPA: AraC family transcriptional regulator [Thermoanaerobaculia bacterium]|nr:AraC family transcriptional regulator [Thermoanaerobaculia bacterium]